MCRLASRSIYWSCSLCCCGIQGPVGPRGVQGVPGLTGQRGPRGPPGTNAGITILPLCCFVVNVYSPSNTLLVCCHRQKISKEFRVKSFFYMELPILFVQTLLLYRMHPFNHDAQRHRRTDRRHRANSRLYCVQFDQLKLSRIQLLMKLHLRTTAWLPYGITQCYLPCTQYKWTHPALTPARGRCSIYLPRRDRRLSWPRWWPITYRHGLPAYGRSPIQVLTQQCTAGSWARDLLITSLMP